MARRAGKPIGRISAFWDTSALVPLRIRQGLTPRAVALYQDYNVVVWWATPVEIASALARLLRMGQIDSNDYAKTRDLAQTLADSWFVVQPSEQLRTQATELIGHYALHAADCKTGRSAAVVRRQTPRPRFLHRRSEVAGSGSPQWLRCAAAVMAMLLYKHEGRKSTS